MDDNPIVIRYKVFMGVNTDHCLGVTITMRTTETGDEDTCPQIPLWFE